MKITTLKKLCIVLATVLCTGQCIASAENIILDDSFEIKTELPDVQIGVPTYYDASDPDNLVPINVLQPGMNVKVKIPVINASSSAENIFMICGVYDSNNTMLLVKANNQNIDGNSSTPYYAYVDVALPLDIGSGCNLKIFIWDSMRHRTAITESFSMPVFTPLDTQWKISGNATVSSDEKLTDLASLQISEGGLAQYESSVEKEKNYSFGFMAKGTQPVRMAVKSVDNDVLLSEDIVPTAEWSKYICSFDSGEHEDVVLSIESADGSGVTYIDSAHLSDNMVYNGSFEHGIICWTDVSESDISTDSRDGSNSISVLDGNKASQVIAINDHQVYSLRFFSKGAATNVNIKTTEGANIKSESISQASDWTENVVYFESSEKNCVIEFEADDGDVLVDNIKVKNTDVVKNSTFESGNYDGYTIDGPASVITENDGNKCLKLTSNGEGKFSLFSKDGIEVEAGTYALSLRFKQTVDTNGYYQLYAQYLKDGSDTEKVTVTLDRQRRDGQDWQCDTFTLTFNEPKTLKLSMACGLLPDAVDGVAIYLDDIILEKIE